MTIGQWSRTSKMRVMSCACCVVLMLGYHVAYAVVEGVSPIPQGELQQLKTEPLALLAKFPEGGAAMAQYVASAITRDPTLVGAMLSVVNVTSLRQAAAMGAGLVRGARALAATQPKAPPPGPS